MRITRLCFAGLFVATACVDTGDEPTAADDSMTGTISEELTTNVTLGSTLVTTDYLNLRSGPSTGYSIIEVIPPGSRVSVVYHTAPDNGFYNVLVGHTVGWSSGLWLEMAHPPAAHTLDTSFVSEIVEPPGSGHDVHGAYYSDANYWNFCAPGATTAAVSYFNTHPATWAAGYFREPYGPHVSDTYWSSQDSVDGYTARGRSYLMYIALEVKPPDFTSKGLPSFSTYPTHGSGLGDTRDVLNWEASGHNANWSSFFYQKVSASGLTAATLHNDVTRDIYGGHAVLVNVDTSYLPNWSHNVGHAITIVGYDDNADTYAYVDTCGHRCNGSTQSKNGGVWHVSQSRMYNAIKAFGAGYAR